MIRIATKRSLCMALALIICLGLLPVHGGAASVEEREQAAAAVAIAYFDKGHSVQYEGTFLQQDIERRDGGATRSTNQVSPEYATPNETMYSVCSDFAHQVYWEAFRINLCGSAGRNTTNQLIEMYKDDPMTAYYWDNTTGKSVGDAITEALAAARPGDVVTSLLEEGGHTMVYVGDVLGDGKTYLCHCWGSDLRKAGQRGYIDNREYGPNTPDEETDPRFGVRKIENSNGGSIRLDEAEPFLRKHYGGKTARKMSFLRPLTGFSDAEYPLRDATKYRMSHPRLAIDRTLNKTRFNSAFTGETVTMTLKLSNSSKQDYTVPVTEKTPAGAKLKTPFAGANAAGETMTMNVELKAGESKTFTAEYEITAKRGEKVVFEGGSVGDIPSNVIPIAVGGAKLTAEENAKLAELANGKSGKIFTAANTKADTIADVIYQKVLGLNVKLPTSKQIMKGSLKEVKAPSGRKTHTFKLIEEVAAEYRDACQMMVPTFWYGTGIRCEWGIERCSDPRDKHLEPGDVIVYGDSLAAAVPGKQYVYLGEGKYIKYDPASKSCPIFEEPEFVALVLGKYFYVLRPTLAYDDIHTLPALADPVQTASFKFTDVKESDWFYTYVKDLVTDGTVSGMTETTFAPNGSLTYGQALKLIALAVGEKEQAKTGTHWATGYLTLAKKKGWLKQDVKLDGTITRLELCKLAAKAKGLTEQPASNPFKDTEDTNVLALNKAGVISGMTATEFKPEGLLTRAQIAKIIWTLRKV